MTIPIARDYAAIAQGVKRLRESDGKPPVECPHCDDLGWKLAVSLSGPYFTSCPDCHNPKNLPHPTT